MVNENQPLLIGSDMGFDCLIAHFSLDFALELVMTSVVMILCFIDVTNGVWSLQEEFEEHAEKAKTLPENTTNENKLILYGLFKQATVGPVNTSRPGIFNMRDRAKWDAWKAVEGKSKEEAMSDYITKVKQLLEEAAASA
ncbi:hypothetical protein SADUNF_Sadunf03G0073800 [Salix dunnii]|uniref:ACB domain-containing protein n=1 Tax=Salix dunnii TaxID=1413687 RepID=A0A835KBV3_9ROSI|nr:hypothetical protein SADUNF_Sadunf03G0073800 [Salix dunnii]